MNNNDNTRSNIRLIQNSSISSMRKNELIQYVLKNPSLNNHDIIQLLQEDQTTNSLSNLHLSHNQSLSCIHYPHKQCSRFTFSCCHEVKDPCHRCHWERDCQVKPPQISSIQCNQCNTTQSPSQECINSECKTIFSTSYCPFCFIWTNAIIFHCNECGICRIGIKENHFHCHTCDTCYTLESKECHECLPKTTNLRSAICLFCFENLHNSQDSFIQSKCNHLMHLLCLNKALKLHHYQCPLCRKEVIDMNEQWEYLRHEIRNTRISNDIIPLCIGKTYPTIFGEFLIQEIINNDMIKGILQWNIETKATLHRSSIVNTNRVDIFCNECSIASKQIFHPFGMECPHCSSFNTTRA